MFIWMDVRRYNCESKTDLWWGRSQYGSHLVKWLMRLVKAAHERTKLY